MAYVEIVHKGKIIQRRPVSDEIASTGCRIRIGRGYVHLKTGQTQTVGSYVVSFRDGQITEDAVSVLPPLPESHNVTVTMPGSAQPAGRKYPQVDGFEINGQLGEGGMGIVWKGVQLSTGRQVAVKFLGSHHFASERARTRFEREVSLAARLKHPSIAQVYDSGLHKGIYYYAMEYIDGVRLDRYVRAHSLSMKQIFLLFKEICEAVCCAHAAGIIHRDLKPSNILVTNEGRPCIVDFGLAKQSLSEAGAAEITVSIEGDITGTPAYMSPEQAMGKIKEVDAQTDVYALGVILYELLTGTNPHDLSKSRIEILLDIAGGEIADPRKLNPDIDNDLHTILMTCLAKKRTDRYPSAAVLTKEITNYLSGEPLLAKSLNTGYRTYRAFRKHQKKIWVSAVFLLLVLVIVLLGIQLSFDRSVVRRSSVPDRAASAKNTAPAEPVASRPLALSDEASVNIVPFEPNSDSHARLSESNRYVAVDFLAQPVSPEEKLALDEFKKIEKNILAGQTFDDTSTPLHLLLSVLSCFHRNDPQRSTAYLVYDPAKLGYEPAEFLKRVGQILVPRTVIRAPVPPAHPFDGQIWPIYLSYTGRTELCDIITPMYKNGKWLWTEYQAGGGRDWWQWQPYMLALLDKAAWDSAPVIASSAPVAAEMAVAVQPSPPDSHSPAVHADKIPEGLVLYYSFDDSTQKWIVDDLSGNQNHGQVQGARWTPGGISGGAYQFNTESWTDMILVPDSDSLDTPYITLSAWVKSGGDNTSWNRLFDKGGTSPDSGYVFCMGGVNQSLNACGSVLLAVNNQYGGQTLRKLEQGKWYHVCATYDGQSNSIYINGSLEISVAQTQGPIQNNDRPLWIGHCFSADGRISNAQFSGLMDELMIFNRALNKEEIMLLHGLEYKE